MDANENEKNDYCDLTSEDEAIAHDLDMHALILSGLNMDNEPVKTAEEVIREIDDIIEVRRCLIENKTSIKIMYQGLPQTIFYYPNELNSLGCVDCRRKRY